MAFLTSTQVIISKSTSGFCVPVVDASIVLEGAVCADAVPASRANAHTVDVNRYMSTPPGVGSFFPTPLEIEPETELLGPLGKLALRKPERGRLQRRLEVVEVVVVEHVECFPESRRGQM